MSDLGDARAEQLLTLLRQLTGQLQRSEAERTVLSEKVAALEKQSQAQGENLVRRIQTAIAQTDRHADRLGQRLSEVSAQVSADEARLAAQLQRIEGVVEETRAIQSRALVVAPQGGMPVRRRAGRGNLAAMLILLIGVGVAAGLLESRLPPATVAKGFAVRKLTTTTSPAAPVDPVAAFLAAEGKATPPVATMKPDPTLPEAIRATEKSALAGNANAQHDLAVFYTSGRESPAADYKKAAPWFRLAALGGIANARYNLGVLYQQGLGVKPDLKEAIGWYEAAAALDHPAASYNLGIASVEGVGLPYDPAAASRDFRVAARAGIPEASYNLGLMYENGMLGPVNLPQEFYWYGRAAALGSTQGRNAVLRLAQAAHLSPEDVGRMIAGLNPDMPPLGPPPASAQPAPPPQIDAPKADPAKQAKPVADKKTTPPSDAAAGVLEPEDLTSTP